MSDAFKFVQNQASTLSGAGCTIGDTSIILTSFQTIDGVDLEMTDFGAIGFGTIEPDNSSQEEQICFTGVTQNSNGTATLTGVKSVGFISPYTQTTGVTKTHPGGVKFIISNTAGFYDKLTSKSDDETIDGLWQFSQSPQVAAQPVLASDVAIKSYVDGIAIAGAAKATNTVYGISKLSTAAVTASVPIVVGDNDTRVPTQAENDALAGNNGSPSSTNTFVTQTGFQRNQENYAVATGTSTAFVVALSPTPVALVAGMQVSFKANVASGTSPTVNVNSLGAKSLYKQGVSGTTPLVIGDFGTNAIIVAEYDGGGFQIVTPPPVAYTAGFGTVVSATVDNAGHQVTTDGFLFGIWSATTIQSIYVDSAATPTTQVAKISVTGGATVEGSFCVPVKRNHYYKITGGATAYFMPLT